MSVPQSPLKYVVITGGVISGLGKGVLASSTGLLLRRIGYKVTAIKIDPYLNVDAGLMSPFEHGEVFILDDGGEADLDLGNYERFLDVSLSRDNNITTGKVYRRIIETERKGGFLGKTVQVIPHVCNLIQDWISEVSQRPVTTLESLDSLQDAKPFITTEGDRPDICIIELGGTVGDIESMQFVESLRQFQFRVGLDNIVLVHVSLIPEVSGGEQKTKPTQSSVRQLRALGLSPNIIACRCTRPLHTQVKEKISQFCHVPINNVMDLHNVSNLFRVPELLDSQNYLGVLLSHLKLPTPVTGALPYLNSWASLAEKVDELEKQEGDEIIHVAFVGKYTGMADSYHCVNKSLLHASVKVGRKVVIDYIDSSDLEVSADGEEKDVYKSGWDKVRASDCILVPGGFGDRGFEGKVLTCKYAREEKVPFLGICLGFQAAVVDIARTLPGLEKATSEEVDVQDEDGVGEEFWAVAYMPEIDRETMGANMRLGARRTLFNDLSSKTAQLYGGKEEISERHRHRFEVNPKFIEKIEEQTTMRFVGRDECNERMHVLELADHPYFVGVQFHPEMKTRPLHPSPVFVGLLQAVVARQASSSAN